MAKVKLRTQILQGNNKKMSALASQQGLSLQDLFYMLAEIDWYCITPDVIFQWRIEGKSIPEELEFSNKPNLIEQTDINTEPLQSVYVEPEIEKKLMIKVHLYGLRSLGMLIDRICHSPLKFNNPDLINGTKKKGKKK